MKRILNIIVILDIGLLICGCRKLEIKPPADITGQWRWLLTWRVYNPSATNPLTPQNTGNQEVLVFNTDNTWYNTVNGIKTDSGLYSLGRGALAAYPGTKICIYDSIAYYTLDGIRLKTGDYYSIRNDTLIFCPYYAWRYSSYTLPYNGSKYWLRVK
jgi:hypothetical protein